MIAFDKEGRVLYSWFHNESIRAYRWKKDKLIVEEVDSQNKRACFVHEAGEKSCYLRKYSYIYLKKTVL